MSSAEGTPFLASPKMTSGKFFGVSALVFATSAAATLIGCESMSAMGEMRMPGGWTMSMTWMRMPGQTWAASAASFVGMWIVMMVAMMLPSLAPTLWSYGQAVAATGARIARLTSFVALGYFFIWAALGFAVFQAGVALASAAIHQPEFARAVPVIGGGVALLAGLLQLTPWKAHHLAFCRDAHRHAHASEAGDFAACMHGMRLGLHCVYSCVPFTAILLVFGVNNLHAMVVVAAAITAERVGVAPR